MGRSTTPSILFQHTPEAPGPSSLLQTTSPLRHSKCMLLMGTVKECKRIKWGGAQCGARLRACLQRCLTIHRGPPPHQHRHKAIYYPTRCGICQSLHTRSLLGNLSTTIKASKPTGWGQGTRVNFWEIRILSLTRMLNSLMMGTSNRDRVFDKWTSSYNGVSGRK
jgi:hypothetical protein